MRAFERFLSYAKVNTQSAEGTGKSPSTDGQWDLARQLVEELRALGLQEVALSEFGVVTAVLPAVPGCESAPALGLLAHMDTAPAFSGEGVTPVIHENYDGGDVVLPKEGRVIRLADFPEMAALKGRTLITADGSTLLGADDKAGIAEIMTLCEELIASGAPHGKLCVAFTPDEEMTFPPSAPSTLIRWTAAGKAVSSMRISTPPPPGWRSPVCPSTPARPRTPWKTLC